MFRMTEYKQGQLVTDPDSGDIGLVLRVTPWTRKGDRSTGWGIYDENTGYYCGKNRLLTVLIPDSGTEMQIIQYACHSGDEESGITGPPEEEAYIWEGDPISIQPAF